MKHLIFLLIAAALLAPFVMITSGNNTSDKNFDRHDVSIVKTIDNTDDGEFNEPEFAINNSDDNNYLYYPEHTDFFPEVHNTALAYCLTAGK